MAKLTESGRKKISTFIATCEELLLRANDGVKIPEQERFERLYDKNQCNYYEFNSILALLKLDEQKEVSYSDFTSALNHCEAEAHKNINNFKINEEKFKSLWAARQVERTRSVLIRQLLNVIHIAIELRDNLKKYCVIDETPRTLLKKCFSIVDGDTGSRVPLFKDLKGGIIVEFSEQLKELLQNLNIDNDVSFNLIELAALKAYDPKNAIQALLPGIKANQNLYQFYTKSVATAQYQKKCNKEATDKLSFPEFKYNPQSDSIPQFLSQQIQMREQFFEQELKDITNMPFATLPQGTKIDSFYNNETLQKLDLSSSSGTAGVMHSLLTFEFNENRKLFFLVGHTPKDGFLKLFRKTWSQNSFEEIIQKLTKAITAFDAAQLNYSKQGEKKTLLTSLGKGLAEHQRFVKQYTNLQSLYEKLCNIELGIYKNATEKESLFQDLLEKSSQFGIDISQKELSEIQKSRFSIQEIVSLLNAKIIPLQSYIFNILKLIQTTINAHNKYCKNAMIMPGETGVILDNFRNSVIELLNTINISNDPYLFKRLFEFEIPVSDLELKKERDEALIEVNHIVKSILTEQSTVKSVVISLNSLDRPYDTFPLFCLIYNQEKPAYLPKLPLINNIEVIEHKLRENQSVAKKYQIYHPKFVNLREKSIEEITRLGKEYQIFNEKVKNDTQSLRLLMNQNSEGNSLPFDPNQSENDLTSLNKAVTALSIMIETELNELKDIDSESNFPETSVNFTELRSELTSLLILEEEANKLLAERNKALEDFNAQKIVEDNLIKLAELLNNQKDQMLKVEQILQKEFDELSKLENLFNQLSQKSQIITISLEEKKNQGVTLKKEIDHYENTVNKLSEQLQSQSDVKGEDYLKELKTKCDKIPPEEVHSVENYLEYYETNLKLIESEPTFNIPYAQFSDKNKFEGLVENLSNDMNVPEKEEFKKKCESARKDQVEHTTTNSISKVASKGLSLIRQGVTFKLIEHKKSFINLIRTKIEALKKVKEIQQVEKALKLKKDTETKLTQCKILIEEKASEYQSLNLNIKEDQELLETTQKACAELRTKLASQHTSISENQTKLTKINTMIERLNQQIITVNGDFAKQVAALQKEIIGLKRFSHNLNQRYPYSYINKLQQRTWLIERIENDDQINTLEKLDKLYAEQQKYICEEDSYFLPTDYYDICERDTDAIKIFGNYAEYEKKKLANIKKTLSELKNITNNSDPRLQHLKVQVKELKLTVTNDDAYILSINKYLVEQKNSLHFIIKALLPKEVSKISEEISPILSNFNNYEETITEWENELKKLTSKRFNVSENRSDKRKVIEKCYAELFSKMPLHSRENLLNNLTTHLNEISSQKKRITQSCLSHVGGKEIGDLIKTLNDSEEKIVSMKNRMSTLNVSVNELQQRDQFLKQHGILIEPYIKRLEILLATKKKGLFNFFNNSMSEPNRTKARELLNILKICYATKNLEPLEKFFFQNLITFKLSPTIKLANVSLDKMTGKDMNLLLAKLRFDLKSVVSQTNTESTNKKIRC